MILMAHLFNMLFLNKASKGELVLSKNMEVIVITSSNILEINFEDDSRKINFTLLENGENIESYEYLILQRDAVPGKTQVLTSYNCNDSIKKQVATKFFNENQELDIIFVVELVHTSNNSVLSN